MLKEIKQYFDWKFFLKFVVIFLLLHYANVVIIGVTTEGGEFITFVDDYMNYPVWVRQAVLNAASFVAGVLGIVSTVTDPFLYLENGSILEMAWPCVGLSMMSFWAAFALAHNNSLKMRAAWTLGGIIAIFSLNVIRVLALILTLHYKWGFQKEISAHELFNYLCYGLIALMIWRFKVQFAKHQTIALA